MRINLPEANQIAKPEQGEAHRNHEYDFEVGMIGTAADSLHVLTESSTPHITVFEKRIGTRLVGGGATSAILTPNFYLCTELLIFYLCLVSTCELTHIKLQDNSATVKAIRLTPPSGA